MSIASLSKYLPNLDKKIDSVKQKLVTPQFGPRNYIGLGMRLDVARQTF